MSKLMTSADLDRYYQQYLKQGYYPQWAMIKAENEVKSREINKSITVNIPGVGDCQYTGD